MTLLSSIVLNKAIDPSQTTSLRAAFGRGMRSRFRHFRIAVVKALLEEDVFGVVTNTSPGEGAFRFFGSSEKIAAFMRWINEEIYDDILQLTRLDGVGRSIDAAWTNRFIEEGYKRGIMRARGQMKGFAPPLDTTGGIDGALVTLAHTDRKAALFVRTFNELKGVTDSMAQQISRVITQGVTDNLPIKVVVNELNKVIVSATSGISVNARGGMSAEDKAQVVARTEVIRAYAEAQLTEFETWGVHGVTVKAEFITAGDARVCSRCSSLEKNLYSIEEARGIIPVHPMCRCVWIPNLTD